jgi:biopolymer transport protein ExbB/biopolymer transport protein TolQ
MKRRPLLLLILTTVSFLAVAIAFGNLGPAKDTGVVEAAPGEVNQGAPQVKGHDGQPRAESPLKHTEAKSVSGEPQPFDICPMGTWRSIGWSTRVVFLILLIMSIWSIVIVVERHLTFSAARNQSREFALKIASSLRRQKIDDAIILSDKYEKNHLASDISGAALDESERELRRATAMKLAEFRRGLSGLATIGSTAPLVGLFGTALSVIDTFTALGDSPSVGSWWVALDFADALLTTAAGFAVGVPAVWLLKYFTDQVDNFAVEMDASSAELLSFFLKQRGKKHV